MRLYLSTKTNIPDVMVDFIEVRLKSGEEVSLNWDESDISRREDGFDARYKGVYFGEEYANGRIKDLDGLKITDIGLYCESDKAFYFRIEEMEFEDDDKSLTFRFPYIPLSCSGMNGVSISHEKICDLAERLVTYAQEYDFYHFQDSIEVGSSLEDVISDMAKELSSHEGVVSLRSALEEIFENEDLPKEQSEELDFLCRELSSLGDILNVKPSLDEQIRSASSRSGQFNYRAVSKEKGFDPNR